MNRSLLTTATPDQWMISGGNKVNTDFTHEGSRGLFTYIAPNLLELLVELLHVLQRVCIICLLLGFEREKYK